MKSLSKQSLLDFNRDAADLIHRLGFQPFPADVPGHDYRSGSLRIMTDYGLFTVHLPHEEYPDTLVSINGRFDSGRTSYPSFDVNPCSGKWNILGGDPPQVIAEFSRRMAWVNARLPTPQEQSAIDAMDQADATRLARERKSWKDWLDSPEGLAVHRRSA